MRRLIVCLLLLLAAESWGQAYTPLTEAQALSYVDRITRAQLASDIIKLDSIEHSTPVVVFPDMVAGTAGNDVWVSWVGDGVMNMSVAGGALDYDVPLPKRKFAGLIHPGGWLEDVKKIGIGLLAGAIIVEGAHLAGVIK